MQNPWSSITIQTIDAINDGLCKAVSWFTLLMVLITLAIVILRYGFDMGWIAMQESVMYLHGMVFLLGSAHTLRVNEHVRVDILYRRFNPTQQARVDLVGSLIFLLPVNLFVFLISFDYVMSSWRILEDSQEAGGIPAVFLLKSLILLFAFLMVLQGVAEVLKNLAKMRQESGNSHQEEER